VAPRPPHPAAAGRTRPLPVTAGHS